MVEENEYKTFTVGVTHFVSPSSPFWDSSKPGICSRRTVRIASGESHDWRVGRSGWEARSFLVFRLYVSIAALKTETKVGLGGGCGGDGRHGWFVEKGEINM